MVVSLSKSRKYGNGRRSKLNSVGGGRKLAQDHTLEIGWRVVGFTSTLAREAMRIVEMFVVAMRKGTFKKILEDLGLTLAEEELSHVPETVQADGSEGCVSDPTPGKLWCDGFYKPRRSTLLL